MVTRLCSSELAEVDTWQDVGVAVQLLLLLRRLVQLVFVFRGAAHVAQGLRLWHCVLGTTPRARSC